MKKGKKNKNLDLENIVNYLFQKMRACAKGSIVFQLQPEDVPIRVIYVG